jgi:hypothetical protein
MNRRKQWAAGEMIRTDEEQQEGLVVAVADAIIYPGAVVVHAQHAARAHAAVVRARRLRPLALLAEAHAAALRSGRNYAQPPLRSFSGRQCLQCPRNPGSACCNAAVRALYSMPCWKKHAPPLGAESKLCLVTSSVSLPD